MRKTTLGKRQKGRQKDEFGENSWKTFHITEKLDVLNSGTLHRPKIITSHQFRCLNVKCQLLPQSKIPSID